MLAPTTRRRRCIYYSPSATPDGAVILDVHNPGAANAGMIKGAELIPDEELLTPMGKSPKGKRIITHRSTSIRTEMAYHKLKQAGYDAAFFCAARDMSESGEFKVTPN